MPHITVTTNRPISAADEARLKAALADIISLVPRKSEKWLMCSFQGNQALWMSGTEDPAAIVDLKLFGKLPVDVFPVLVKKLTDLLAGALEIPPERIYVSCLETPYWGWNGTPL